MSSTGDTGASAVSVASNIGVSSYVGGDNPLTGDGAPLRPSTASLTSVIRYALNEYDKNLRIAMPGYVEKVYDDYYVDVRPGYMLRYRNEKAAHEMPVLPQISVMMPQGQNYALRLPVAKGDTGLVVVLDRSLDAWLANETGEPVDPKSPNVRRLSDAVFIPGLLTEPATKAAGVTSGALKVQNHGASLQLSATGGVKLGNQRAEIVDIISQLTAIVSAIGKQVPVPPANIDALVTLINLLKG